MNVLKDKGKETDSKCKLNYTGILDEYVKEKVKLSDWKRKENSQVLKEIQWRGYLIAFK